MRRIYGKKTEIDELVPFDDRENLTPAEQKYYDEYWAEYGRQQAEEIRKLREEKNAE